MDIFRLGSPIKDPEGHKTQGEDDDEKDFLDFDSGPHFHRICLDVMDQDDQHTGDSA